MDPFITGSAITAGAGLVGASFGGDKTDENMWRVNYQAQKEFAQNGIRWRVEDAKAAGLHPLFALGGGGAAFSPPPTIVTNDGMGEAIANAGQAIGNAVSRQETPEQKIAKDLLIKESQARISKDDAQAAYYWSLAMREYQQDQGQPGFPSLLGNVAGGLRPGGSSEGITIPARLQYAPGNADAITLKPNEVVSNVTGQPWMAPGKKPMWDRADFGLPGLRNRAIPRTDDFWETWGELSWYDKAAIIAASMYLGDGTPRMPAAKVPDPWQVFGGHTNYRYGVSGDFPRR